jgi:hypothetical protein
MSFLLFFVAVNLGATEGPVVIHRGAQWPPPGVVYSYYEDYPEDQRAGLVIYQHQSLPQDLTENVVETPKAVSAPAPAPALAKAILPSSPATFEEMDDPTVGTMVILDGKPTLAIRRGEKPPKFKTFFYLDDITVSEMNCKPSG